MTDAEVIPGIFEKDGHGIEQKMALVAPFVSWVHLYVSDGSMGVESTVTDESDLTGFAKSFPNVSFEAHILAANPEKYVRRLADSGFRRIIAHVECNDPRRFLEEVKYDEVEVGIAVDGATEIDQVEPFLEGADFVVVMTAEAGITGGTFLPEAVEKIRLIRQNYPDLPIEAVGGITDATAKTVKEAGATRLVSSAFLFAQPDSIAETLELLKTV